MPTPPLSDRSSRAAAANAARGSSESRGVDVLTVNWMLTVMTCTLCELLAAACEAWLRASGQRNDWISLLGMLMLFSALVSGTIGLVLFAFVIKLRRVRPPLGVIAFSLLVCLIPWIVVAWQQFG